MEQSFKRVSGIGKELPVKENNFGGGSFTTVLSKGFLKKKLKYQSSDPVTF